MLNISRDSLIGRIYAYWQRMGGRNKPGYSENLCHLFWVIVLFAPWRWFWKHTYKDFIQPWMIAILGFLVWASFSVQGFLQFIGTIILSLIVVAVFIFLIALALERDWSHVRSVANRLLRPIKSWTRQLFNSRPIKQLSDWFLHAPLIPWGVPPAAYAFLLFQVSAFWWAPPIAWAILISEVVIIGVIVVFVVAAFVFERAQAARVRLTELAESPGMNTAQTTLKWISTVKHRTICPFIKFV